ncbi:MULTISPECIES: D-alanyl-D-alanine carboxypeptidase family protein [unclassified Bacillus (in: firmicutes)]|uniref:M15 family metallopeptidase n=1 Tax=unclassified Bacillus (in: firmicutes) TaxID=185979 RepID=UPI0008E0239F|nr:MULTISPECIES: M15 family metallopeptidase [unclassified Bacillus (in: firmicutes)]SFA91983.1 D-alanyl-D-alanine carboxypeptidase [Bacillus sp. UNCCL13]SFQ85745.1 D-alanyl-D-alanine carboxypeptidase [Bacillus sp. cl95]
MKKIAIIIVSMMILNGCSQIENIKKKVPFLNDQEKNGQEQQSESVKESEANQNDTPESQPITPSEEQNVLTLESFFFNELKEVNGKNIIQNPDNILALVNKQAGYLPADYIPNDLVRPNVLFSFGDEKLEKSFVRQEAARALESMFLAGKQVGVELIAVSGYRSYDRQQTIFQAEIDKVGLEQAALAVAIPGQSEHQTGLSMDISSKSTNLDLTEEFGVTKEGKWLAENAHKFGYILRYPKGKEGITGYQYEPWHFRYVGKTAAEIIYKKKWTLEEYFNEVKKI